MLINELAPPAPSFCLNLITGLAFKGTLPSPANEFWHLCSEQSWVSRLLCLSHEIAQLHHRGRPPILGPHRATHTQASSPLRWRGEPLLTPHFEASNPTIYSAPSHDLEINRDMTIYLSWWSKFLPVVWTRYSLLLKGTYVLLALCKITRMGKISWKKVKVLTGEIGKEFVLL